MVGRHAAGRRRAALATLGTLVLTGIPTAAAAAPPPAPGPLPSAPRSLGADRPSPQVLRAMERDLRLTRAQAATRLVNEEEAGTRAGRLRNSLGKHFAGAWVSGKTSAELTVATTRQEDVAAIRAQGAKAVVVRTPLSALEGIKAKLDAAAARVKTGNAPVWYVDVPGNRVVVEATTQSAAAAFIDAAGVEDLGVTVRLSANRPRLMGNLVGGDAYYINNSARCSIGFSITKSRQQGFVSAGHCGKPGDRTTGYNKADQGTFQASTFPGRDMSWVAVNDGWTATAGVKGEGGRTSQVAGSVQALVGASVCRSGSTSGWHCGTVQQYNASVDYAQGTVNGLTRTTVCSEPGDSGGPFVSGAQAQGVTSGGSGDCTAGGTTFYQPVNPILSTFGLALKTASVQTGPPAPQGTATATAWSVGHVYEVGATVIHAGVRYQCLQTHQAQGAWSPADTPALWQRM
ncbi:alpha-lytic protease prodomain-containing protein [Streptomyces coacervatus]|uniref:Alpha-lytic protease prodomain-containing protein n=1 Tax=Streptomyces coacervatus TaxID=647381 RepID=A0ABP7JA15_9ACTN|nr:carbohydrate-binding protein [Streptomyces coacervatus]MDF2270357.1 alpha-lytic protease prodomain-containing protein [Streptomyces coacervatus]